jgi:hypothetical protein
MKYALRMVFCAVVLATGACSASDSFTEPYEALTGSLKALRDTGSVTAEIKVSLNGSTLDNWIEWKATRRTSFGNPDRSVLEGGGTVVFPSQQPRHNLDLTELVIGQDRYYQSLRLRLPAGKKWLKPDQRTSVQFGSQIANADLGVLDPLPFLELVADVDKAGALGAQTDQYEDINGVRTRRYNVRCGLNKDCDIAAFPADFNRVFNGESPITISVFLDEDKRPHRILVDGWLSTGLTASGAHNGFDIHVAMTLSDFGKPVEVTEPPAAETTDDFRVELT